MPYAEIDGVKIYYESHGNGFPLVLCHGLSGDTEAWVNQVPVFSQKYRVVTWDARGHGRSDSPADPDAYGLTRFAEDLKGCWTTWGFRRRTCWGTPWAGAWWCASRRPTRNG